MNFDYLDGCWSHNDRKDVIEFIKPILNRFLFKEALPNLEVPLKKLTGLSEDELHLLKTVHFLLSPEVNDFIEELPKLLHNLAHSTYKELIESRGIIRGRIDWNLTFKERFSQGFNDPSLFICQPSTKMYDLPENQLLNFMLWKICSLTEKIDLEITEELLFYETWNNWKDIIISRYLRTKKISKNIYFQQISMPRVIKPKTVQKAYHHRNQSYDKVAECYELYEKLFIINDPDALRDLIEKQTLEPLNDDKLFEIYVLFKIINFFDYMGGNLEMGLLKPGLKYIAKYESEEMNACIFHQKMPYIFSQNSKNKDIFDFYDLNVSLRRPDIILKIETQEKKLYYIIEVKRTKERGYIVDSVYKVLGYITDFEKCLNPEENPQGMLVVWDEINILDWNKAFENPVVILKHDDFDKGLEKIINSFNNNGIN